MTAVLRVQGGSMLARKDPARRCTDKLFSFLLPLSFLEELKPLRPCYIGSAKRCGAAPKKNNVRRGGYKYLAIHIHGAARQRARGLSNTPEFSKAQRQRQEVEALFSALKNQIGLLTAT
jgi:hypothetical protein